MNKVFQTDSDIVKKQRRANANYSVEIDYGSPNTDKCIIWFCSNAIYFPNNIESFNRSIIKSDYYEWRQNVPISARKHIFVRDIYKQWYLSGINDEVNTPSRLLDLLRNEISDYKTIAVGSSAGGYAAMLYGTLLGVERIFAFNPQFELNSLLETSNELINPLVFRLKDDNKIRLYYDIVPLIGAIPIYYFVSENSSWDKIQLSHLGFCKGVRIIRFKSSHHGVPFLRVAIPKIFSSSKETLDKLDGKIFSPLLFSIQFAGICKTIKGVVEQGVKYIKKKLVSR